jgi:hypothetical protein
LSETQAAPTRPLAVVNQPCRRAREQAITTSNDTLAGLGARPTTPPLK